MRYDRTIVAYHGCDAVTADRILKGEPFRASENLYDWLGAGIYFWEYGADRALEFAEFQRQRGKVTTPAVVGAILQLGNCFDLMDTKFTGELPSAFRLFKRALGKAEQPLPKNEGKTPDKKLRKRDCAVMNFHLHAMKDQGIQYDSVRCGFVEGPPAFSGSGIRRQSHVQICIRSPGCILGVFRPMM